MTNKNTAHLTRRYEFNQEVIDLADSDSDESEGNSKEKALTMCSSTGRQQINSTIAAKQRMSSGSST